jgi:hypothetical protein
MWQLRSQDIEARASHVSDGMTRVSIYNILRCRSMVDIISVIIKLLPWGTCSASSILMTSYSTCIECCALFLYLPALEVNPEPS